MSLRDETISPYANTRPSVRRRDSASAEIQSHIDEYMARGGKIQKVPPGASGYEATPHFVIDAKKDHVGNMKSREHLNRKRAD